MDIPGFILQNSAITRAVEIVRGPIFLCFYNVYRMAWPN